MLHKKIGIVIKRCRKDKGLSQEELGGKCQLHRTYIGMVERGEKNLTINSLEVISHALDKKAYEIIKESECG